MRTQGVAIHLTDDEMTLLIDALDSHEYWQLSESGQRRDGYSMVEDGENDEIDAVRRLMKKLDQARPVARPGP